MFPVETIIEKYKSEDYDFFLSKGNFLKVADTLEKFGANLDMEHADAKHFVMFKKKLYKLYEARSRSVLEHSQFSAEIPEDELTHVYDAHKHHLSSIMRENYLDRISVQARLKGAYYKRKWMSPARLKGLTSGFLSFGMWAYHPYIIPYFAWWSCVASMYYALPITAALVGLYHLSESNVVHSINRIDSGANAGKIRISVLASPIVSRDIIADPAHIHDGGRVNNHGYSALKVTQGYWVSTGTEFKEEKIFAIETADNGNAWIDHEGLDWLLQKKTDDSETNKLYADLVHSRAKGFASVKRDNKDMLYDLKYVIERK